MSKQLKAKGITGEIIFNTRFPQGAAGEKVAWSQVEDILLEQYFGGAENRGKGTIDSAIPLRRMLQEYQARQAGNLLKPDTKRGRETIVKLRHAGHGWPAIQARMVEGTTIKAVQEAYTAGGGDQPIEGRLYVRADGSLNWVGESTAAIHKAKAEGQTLVPPAEVAEAPAVDLEVPAEAPKPKRRRRTPKAAA